LAQQRNGIGNRGCKSTSQRSYCDASTPDDFVGMGDTTGKAGVVIAEEAPAGPRSFDRRYWKAPGCPVCRLAKPVGLSARKKAYSPTGYGTRTEYIYFPLFFGVSLHLHHFLDLWRPC
jgi:hypothetical protein